METPLNLFTISPDEPFVDTLAKGLLARAGDVPLQLAKMRVLLPTRRAISALRDAFLRHSEGRPLLLPNMQPIGDVDEEELLISAWFDGGENPLASLSPAMPSSRRLLLLARLIDEFNRNLYGGDSRFDQAVYLARELAAFLDESARENADMDNLAGLVPAELAEHWLKTLDFLKIITHQWPNVLAEEGRMEAVQRRSLLLKLLAEHWRAHPPAHPVVAAGTTGSTPATAELLRTIAGLEQGMVVLPGLDTHAPDAVWQAVDITHPQYGMKQLLDGMEADRAQVRPWLDGGEETSPRLQFVQAALQPAATTESWQQLALPWEGAVSAMKRVDLATTQEEATAVALMLREVLETPGKTAALITPNRQLARRVAAQMARFHVAVDDSAGIPLSDTPPGIFLRLLATAAAGKASPVSLLSLLKHPLSRFSQPAVTCRKRTRELERMVLRGVRPGSGFESILQTLKQKQMDDLVNFVECLAKNMTPLSEAMEEGMRPLHDLLAALIQTAETCSRDEHGNALVWFGDAGESLAAYLNEILESGDVAVTVQPASLPHVLTALLAGKVWRPPFGLHPRLKILSPMEARLQQFDRVILASLNEGMWPAESGHDPWMSRPMRADFGLPLPERAVGLSAHDFVGLAMAPEVILTRAVKEGGAPTVPSRWLVRMEAVLGVLADEETVQRWRHSAHEWRQWAAGLDAVKSPQPCNPPAPTPPVDARPRMLSVTAVEALLRNPYEIYAKRILRLRKLDPLDQEPDMRLFGNLIHEVIERFSQTPPDATKSRMEQFMECGEAAFTQWLNRPAVWTFWWPRLLRIARQFMTEHEARLPQLQEVLAESEGRMHWPAPGGEFNLIARMDRVELWQDGTLRIIDFKTGAIPKNTDIMARIACQLLLSAVIAEKGEIGGKSFAKNPVADLEYWPLKGGQSEKALLKIAEVAEKNKGSLDELLLETWLGLQELIAAYDDPDMPYLHTPAAEHKPKFDDYGHLARVKEWGA